MSLSKPEFPSQLFSEHFDLKFFLSPDLIREPVALQHRQTTGEAKRMGDFAPDNRAAEGRHGRHAAERPRVHAQELRRQA